MESFITKTTKINDSVLTYVKSTSRPDYDLNVLNWQYHDPKSNFCIVEKGDRLYGTQGMIHVELVYQGLKIDSSKSETTYLSSDCRGTGVFEQLYELSTRIAFDSGSKFIWGFTALGELWRKKLGFEYADIINESVIYLNSGKTDDLKRRFYKKAIRFFVKLKLLSGTTYKWKISETITDFDFIKEFYGREGIYLDYQSHSFINRTTNSPFINYKVMSLYDKNELTVKIIYHITNGSFVISDIQYKEDLNVGILIKTIVSFCIKNLEVSEIRFWANKYNKKYNAVFNEMKPYLSKEYKVTDMQLIYHTKMKNFELEDLFINSLWTEGRRY